MLSADVMQAIVNKEKIDGFIATINSCITCKRVADAKLYTEDLIRLIKDAPNRAAFVTELKNAEAALKQLGGTNVPSSSEKAKLQQESGQLVLFLLGFGSLWFGWQVSDTPTTGSALSWIFSILGLILMAAAGAKPVIGVAAIQVDSSD